MEERERTPWWRESHRSILFEEEKEGSDYFTFFIYL